MKTKLLYIAILGLIPFIGFGQVGVRTADTALVATVGGTQQVWKSKNYYANALSTKQAKIFYNVKDFGALGNGVNDDTESIQTAINSCYSSGGGTVFFPIGRYIIGGALKTTSMNGGVGNSQLYIPFNDANNSIVINLEGESPTDWEAQATTSVPLVTGGVILESNLVTTDSTAFILQSHRPNTPGIGFNTFSYVTPSLKNMGFRKKVFNGTINISNSIGGLDFGKATKMILDMVKVDINTALSISPDPTGSGSKGIIAPQINNHALLSIGNVFILGFDTGIIGGEHLNAKYLDVAVCNVGIRLPFMHHSLSMQTLQMEGNKINILVTGNSKLDILNYNTEHYNGPEWYAFNKDVVINSGATGRINMLGTTMVKSNVGEVDEFIYTNNSPNTFRINRASTYPVIDGVMTIYKDASGVDPAMLLLKSNGATPRSVHIGASTDGIGYIQSVQEGVSNTNTPLILNPNGGAVGVGTRNPIGAFMVKPGLNQNIAILPAADGITFSSFNDLITENRPLNFDASVIRFKINGAERGGFSNDGKLLLGTFGGGSDRQLQVGGRISSFDNAIDSTDVPNYGQVLNIAVNKADLNSPALTGTPTAPTATAGTNTTQIATTAFVQNTASSGTYTPTFTGASNVSSFVSAGLSHYSKIGDQVTVTGSVQVKATTADTPTYFNITLPIASTFTGGEDAAGVSSGSWTSGSGQISVLQPTVVSAAYPGNPTLVVMGFWSGASVGASHSHTLMYSFIYTVK